MSVDNLIGSRYELNISQEGCEDTLRAKSYQDIYECDLPEPVTDPAEEVTGYVHSIEVGSTVDGPGIRFVLFVSGCLLRCQYCHNPDTWHRRNGTRWTIGKIMAKIGKYADVLRISKGGLTISGGEPALQADFTKRIFKESKALGIHTCIDTAGLLGKNFSDDELQDIDLQLLDIKSGDPEIYREVTRQPLQPTIDYAKRLSDLGRPMWVRFVLVPGLTDQVDNVEKVADICAGLKTLERVEILRFHQMGMDKWRKLGIPYSLAETEPPSPELTERVREQFRSRGLTVF
jgi:pyruvate formate lyase activating enzyme